MAAPTSVHVESNAPYETSLGWTYAGASNVGIYRSVSGGAYSLLATVSAATVTYVDTELTARTKYAYKLSDDVGVSYSSIVTVWTHLATTTHGGATAGSFGVPPVTGDVLPQDFNNLALRVEQQQAANERYNDPCPACVEEGAVVIDCTSGCRWFRLVVDQDINSISLIGCPDCPEIDMLIPPNATYGICGWPPGCDFNWKECVDAPLSGGTRGKTAKTFGYTINGYGGQQPGRATGGCGCNRVSTGTYDTLRIQCCESDDDCSMTCEESMTIKACGGAPPYTWTSSGNVSLSDTGTAAVRATSTASGTAGVFPGSTAWILPRIRYDFIVDAGVCGNGFIDTCVTTAGQDAVDTSTSTSLLDGRLDCDSAALADGLSFAGGEYPGNTNAHLNYSGRCCGVACDLDSGPGTWATSAEDCTSATETSGVTLTATPAGQSAINGTIWSGAAAYSQDKVFASGSNNVSYSFTTGIDVRTQAMIDGGCGCSQGTTTVTVTDSVGSQVTLVLN